MHDVFAVGQIVRRRRDGLEMTIDDVRFDQVHCIWFDRATKSVKRKWYKNSSVSHTYESARAKQIRKRKQRNKMRIVK